MKILIASGIYPPDIGGPAQYARNLFETWRAEGHDVKVAAYRWERAAPPLVRHLLYLTKIMRKGWNADLIIVLDTWSAAVPTMVACMLMRKKYILRTGGDFLWESYVERTSDLVLFREFYDTRMGKLSFKEKLVFKWGGAALRRSSAVIFSTDWQRRIFEPVYKLDRKKDFIVENYCGAREAAVEPDGRVFIAGSRAIALKNAARVIKAFESANQEIVKLGFPVVELDRGKAMYDNFVEKIRNAYAVLLVSLSEISPNMIFDAIRLGVPFIVTKETGVAEKIKGVAVFADPLDEDDIKKKIVWMSDPKNRAIQATKLETFDFRHSWEEIAKEIFAIWHRLS